MKRVYKRIISVALALTVAVGSVCWQPPKAKAVVTETAALGAAATVCVVDYSTAMMVFSGMKTGAATSSVIGLMDTYAAATGVAASGTALASTIATGILVAGGTLLVGAAAAALIGGFIDWLREEKEFSPGSSPLNFGALSTEYAIYGGVQFPIFDVFWNKDNFPYAMIFSSNPYLLAFMDRPAFYNVNEECFKSYPGTSFVIYKINSSFSSWLSFSSGTDQSEGTYTTGDVLWSNHNILGTDQSLKVAASAPVGVYDDSAQLLPKPQFQEIPNEIPEGQILSIDTGLSTLPQDDPQAIADAIMQSAIDGALDPNVSVVTDPTVTPDPDPGTDPEPGGAETTSWLSRILESIKSLPQKIAEAISSIFVPSPDFFPTAISNLRDAYSDRMGLLTYPISVLFDFLDRILNLNNQQPILRWDNIYLPGYSGRPVVAAGQYNLNDTLSTSAGRQVHEIYLVVVDAIMILAFLDLCRRKYQKIIRN